MCKQSRKRVSMYRIYDMKEREYVWEGEDFVEVIKKYKNEYMMKLYEFMYEGMRYERNRYTICSEEEGEGEDSGESYEL